MLREAIAGTWIALVQDVVSERIRQVARICNALNQLARWANTRKATAEVALMVAQLVSFEWSFPTAARIDRKGRAARQGSARALVDFLVGERDAGDGRRRDGIEVLRGNPENVATVADSLEFGRGYTSTMIAWTPEDRPTVGRIEAVLNEFE